MVGDLLGMVVALVAGLVIGILILVSSLPLLRETLQGMMEGASLSIDPQAVGKALAGVPGVTPVHDLHPWRLRSDENLISAHLVMHDIAGG